MWARGRAKRRERQRLRAELDVQTAAEISEPVLIHLQHRSAHCCGLCTAEGSPAIRQRSARNAERGVITFMYPLSSGILPSAISLLLPMKTFPKQKHVPNQREAGGERPELRHIIKAHVITPCCSCFHGCVGREITTFITHLLFSGSKLSCYYINFSVKAGRTTNL